MPFLLNKTFVAKRTRILRNDYMLTTTQLAVLLGFKRKASITAIETGRSTPSYEIMMHLVQLFGVSANWLMGYSNAQYEEDVLSAVERICPEIKAADLGIDAVTNNYLNLDSRRKKYSYWARANIVYFRNLLANNDMDELHDIMSTGKIHLGKLLSGKIYTPVFGQISLQIETLMPDVLATFDKLGFSAIPGYRSVILTNILGLQINLEMTNDDIIFFCIDHYDAQSGAACFFIEKVYPSLKQDPRIQSSQKLKDKLENLWEEAYRIRDQYIKK